MARQLSANTVQGYDMETHKNKNNDDLVLKKGVHSEKSRASMDAIQGWFCSLKPEDRDMTTTIHDDAFVEMIFDLVAERSSLLPSSRQQRDSDAIGTSREDYYLTSSIEQGNLDLVSLNSVTTTIDEVRLRYEKSSGGKMNDANSLDLSSRQGNQIEASLSKSRSLGAVLGASSLSHGGDTTLTNWETNHGILTTNGKVHGESGLLVESQITAQQPLQEDEYRIRNKDEHESKSVPTEEPIMTKMTESVSCIFPSIIRFIAKERNLDGISESNRNAPLLTFDPAKLAGDNSAALSKRVARCYDEYSRHVFAKDTPFWIHWLLHRDESTKMTSVVSLATLIQARLEVAVTDAFRLSKENDQLPSSALKDVLYVAKELGSLVTNDDLKELRAIFEEPTPCLFPSIAMSSMMKIISKTGSRPEIDKVFERIVSTLWDRAQTSGFALEVEQEPTKNETREKEAALPETQPVGSSASTNGGKKKNKRKKKKKKKTVTVDAAVQAPDDVREVMSQSLQKPPVAPKPTIEKNSNSPSVVTPLAVERTLSFKDDESVRSMKGVPSFDTSIGSLATETSQTMFESSSKSVALEGDGIRISRMEGVGTIVVAPSISEPPKEDKTDGANKSKLDDGNDNDDDEWETVESKNRGGRNKKKEPFGTVIGGLGRKQKSGRTAANRKRDKNRKMAKEIISSILDVVDVEARQREEAAAKEATVASSSPTNIGKRLEAESNGAKSMSTLKSIVLGTPKSPQNNLRKSSHRANADQSTTQTVPETLSGTSTSNTQSSFNTDQVSDTLASSRALETTEEGDAQGGGDSSSNEPIGESKNENEDNKEVETSPPPPLQTLLGPGMTNSATSSVASSLEAPHASSRRHHHHSSCNQDTVGYHLLDVCDRLSRDMNVFMERRSVALSRRRQERGALVSALQDAASAIWPRRCHVEMYGSCATQLDLPSSDIDIVVRGLDDDIGSSKAGKKVSPLVDNPYLRKSLNGQRVIQLAGELEMQPWAVQVKAIPTASVPVVKILADPSRLPGAVSSPNNRVWMMQHHMTPMQPNIFATTASDTSRMLSFGNGINAQGGGQPVHQYSHPWRGADVMNGLFQIDVTFEGPEHGGIGSTTFSAQVVEEASKETGLPPEQTPAVQTLMVLKELLAQRRLNEPFSGGLSSYALLLLVVAMLKERKAIREEMERIERHRRGLEFIPARGSASNSLASTPVSASRKKEGVVPEPLYLPKPRDESVAHPQPDTVPRSTAEKTSKIFTTEKTNRQSINAGGMPPKPPASKSSKTSEAKKPSPKSPKKSASDVVKGKCSQGRTPSNRPSSSPTAKPVVSSWASIARKNTPQSQIQEKQTTMPPPGSTRASTTPQKPKKISSFAEAVSGPKPVPKQAMSPKPASSHEKPTAPSTPKRKTMADIAKGASKKEAVKQTSVVSDSKSSLSLKKEGEKVAQTGDPDVTRTEMIVLASTNSTSNMSTLESQNSLSGTVFMFPQGSNDVLEVLCSGEATAGKLLMHFLLFYGQHFDSRTTAIDVIGSSNGLNTYPSPYVPRRSGGTIDPVTGMLTVDPIVLYDPWEGAKEGSNVARSCYAWNSIRWHFAQCYMTLSSAVERSGTPAATPSIVVDPQPMSQVGRQSVYTQVGFENDKMSRDATKPSPPPPSPATNQADPSCPDAVSPLLELLLSF